MPISDFTSAEARDLATRIRRAYPQDGLEAASDEDTLSYHRDQYADEKSDADWFKDLDALPNVTAAAVPSGGFKQFADAFPKPVPRPPVQAVAKPAVSRTPKKPLLPYEDRVGEAWMQHVARGLRAEISSDDGVPQDAPDEDVIRFYRDTYASSASADEFNQFVADAYSHNFKAPDKTFGEKAGDVARGLKAGAPSMAQQFAGQAGAQTVAALAKKSVWKLGAPILGGAYIARLAAQIHNGHQLAAIADSIAEPDVPALRKHYFEKLGPGLKAKGYTDDQIAREVQRRVSNVVRGYVATQQSLMGDVEATSQEMMASAAEGMANVGLLGYGGGFFKNALLSGARRAAGRKAANAVSNTIAGRLVSHAVEGAGIGASYGAATGAVEAGAHASQEGRPVTPAVAGGAVRGGVGGAAGGAAIGGPLGAAMDAIGSKAILDAAIQTPAPPRPVIVSESAPPPRVVEQPVQPPSVRQPVQYGRPLRRESAAMQAARPHLERRNATDFVRNLERELRRKAAVQGTANASP